MKLDEIIPLIGNVPHMTVEQGTLIYQMILDNDISEILELGIAHGTGSCYMAAALDEKGKGSVVTIDNQTALGREPNIHDLLKKCNLEKYVTPIFANTTYNWELMKLIEQQTENGVCTPLFDLCYIDGAHNFEVDACAFFLADKLLKPGGLMMFDDVFWTYGSSPGLKDTDWVKSMAEDERTTPQVKKIVELLALQHPGYEDGSLHKDWFIIRKSGASDDQRNKSVSLTDYERQTTIMEDVKGILRKMKRKMKPNGSK